MCGTKSVWTLNALRLGASFGSTKSGRTPRQLGSNLGAADSVPHECASVTFMKTPMRRRDFRSADADTLCGAQAGRWILAVTILGSSMAFIDGTVVNVALPRSQASLHATVVDMQWVVESYGLFLGSFDSGRGLPGRLILAAG